ncbi:hypothetical protein LRP88_11432 [Fusarium phalaenopsidis]|nr:MFS domain-containing protein [Fusarium sp. Ph1]
MSNKNDSSLMRLEDEYSTTSGVMSVTPGPYDDDLYTDEKADKMLLRKLDRWIIPPMILLYLFSFFDRVNIGNARLYGLEEDLDLVDDQYQLSVSILFVTYTLSEVPSNIVLKKFTPSRWLALITTGWGVVANLTGIVQSFHGLIICRLLLGALEGGLLPGLAVYLTFFYTKRELALCIAYLFVSSAIAGSAGGLLANAIGFMYDISEMRGWQWILILKGVPAVILGNAAWFWLANDPKTAHFLSDEQDLVVRRMQRQVGHTISSGQLHKKDAYAGFLD